MKCTCDSHTDAPGSAHKAYCYYAKEFVATEPNPPIPTTILDTAKNLVYGDRAAAYGHPKDNFNNIAELWNGYLAIMKQRNGEYFTNIDIAILNILQKVARLGVNQTHMDSIVDIAGYAATMEKIINKK